MADEEKDQIKQLHDDRSYLIELLMQLAQRQKDYGPKLTSLAIMALVSMCNYKEEIN